MRLPPCAPFRGAPGAGGRGDPAGAVGVNGQLPAPPRGSPAASSSSRGRGPQTISGMFSGVQTGGGSQTRVPGPRGQSWASHICPALPDKLLTWWLRLSRGLGEAADPCTLPGRFLSLPSRRDWPLPGQSAGMAGGAGPGVSQARSRSAVPGRQPEPRASTRAPRPRPGPLCECSPCGENLDPRRLRAPKRVARGATCRASMQVRTAP